MGVERRMKPQNGVKVHNVTAPPAHRQTPISLCKYAHSDPQPHHRRAHTRLFYDSITDIK